MKKKLLIGLFLFCFSTLFSQNPTAIVIDYQVDCIVKSKSRLTVTRKLLLKILSPGGRDYGVLKIYYNSDSPIDFISATILDSNKKIIRKVRKRDIGDYSQLSEYLYTDSRYKQIEAVSSKYPYFVELNYRQDFHNYYYFPMWYPQYRYNILALHSSYKLTVPDGYDIHYKFYNFTPEERIILTKKDQRTYVWEAENIKPINTNEHFIPPVEQLFPMGNIVPDYFVAGGVSGDMLSWKDFGKWNSKLIEGLDNLTDEESVKIKEMVSTATSTREKVKIIYQYLQDYTRYVCVLEGDGRFKPFDANYVCKNKYGDCKALTNYMKALLKIVGIDSYYCLINAGYKQHNIDTSLVSALFNHAVLLVPLTNDSLWIECTNQELPFGYWGTFTQGRYALICDYDNSSLVKTPTLDKNENGTILYSAIEIKGDMLLANTLRTFTGKLFEYVTVSLNSGETLEKLKRSYRLFPYTNKSFQKLTYISNPDNPYSINELSKLIIKHHVQTFGNKLVLTPYYKVIHFKWVMKPSRDNPIYIAYNSADTDTITYQMPKGYQIKELPRDSKIVTRFGIYEQTYKIVHNKLKITKHFEIKANTYSKENYPDFKNFIDSIIKIENQKLLFNKL